MTGKLEGAARAEALQSLDGWTEVDGRDAIARTYRFDDFAQAFGFMSKVATEADRMDHHPEWCNVFNTVEVTLASHDVGGVSERDIALARAMDQAADQVAGG